MSNGNGIDDLKKEVASLRRALEETEAALARERAAHEVRVDRFVSDEEHRVSFVPGEPPPHRDLLPALLERAFFEWLRNHPRRVVRSVLGIVQNGATSRIHLWHDERPVERRGE